MNPPSTLRLVASDERHAARRAAAEWLSNTAPDPIPESPTLLARLVDSPSEVRADDFEAAITDLVDRRELFRVQIGAVTHLTREAGRSPTATFDEQRHRLDVRIDLEKERQLLFRLALVLEGIALFLLLRQFMLDTTQSGALLDLLFHSTGR